MHVCVEVDFEEDHNIEYRVSTVAARLRPTRLLYPPTVLLLGAGRYLQASTLVNALFSG